MQTIDSMIELFNMAVWPGDEGGWVASSKEGSGIDYHGPTLHAAVLQCFTFSKLPVATSVI